MLLNLHKKDWTEGLRLRDFEEHQKSNAEVVKVRALQFCPAKHASRRLTFFSRTGHAVVGIELQQVGPRRIDLDTAGVCHLLAPIMPTWIADLARPTPGSRPDTWANAIRSDTWKTRSRPRWRTRSPRPSGPC